MVLDANLGVSAAVGVGDGPAHHRVVVDAADEAGQ